MKKTYFILSLLVLMSCSGEEKIDIIQRIDEISIFDVGNEGDVTDMRVVFSILNVGRVGEFRIMIIPGPSAASFTKKKAFLLTEDRYQTVELSNNQRYSVRLSDLLDVEGNPVTPGQSYVSRILMLGEEFNQLSVLQSNQIVLSEQGIYNGYYEGILTHNIAGQGFFLPEDQSRTIVVRGEFSENIQSQTYQASIITETQANFGGPNINEGSIRISFNENVISTFEVSGTLIPFEATYKDCKSTNTGRIGGQVKNDLQLEIRGTGCTEGRFEMILIRAMP